jgi:hypothetical protein
MEALAWMERLIALAAALQTLELFQIREAFSSRGIWRWETLEAELPMMGLLLGHPGFLVVLALRLVSSAGLGLASFGALPAQWALASAAVLAVSSALVSLRWRGTFNGGSDYMTLIVIGACLVARASGGAPLVVAGCHWYVALQACLSYLVAGVAKARQAEWRTGRALSGFLGSSYYGVPRQVRSLARNRRLMLACSWAIMVFECSFPASLLGPSPAAAFVGLALLFHLGNAYALGLNRFLWAWAAAYPALLWCAGHPIF